MSFSSFNVASLSMGEMMREYNGLQPLSRANRLQGDDLPFFAALSDALKKNLTLEIVTPEQRNGDLHEQLAGRDRVHEFGAKTLDDLKTYRLGCFDSNKTALALVNPYGENGGRQILCAIYIYWQNDGGGPISDPRLLTGNVAHVLRQKVWSDDVRATQAAIFYSISSFKTLAGAGQMLIERMHEFLVEKTEADIVLSTLSPMRDFGGWLKDMAGSGRLIDDARKNDMTLRVAALEFLLHNRDATQMFHMGNGATIGDVNLNANSASSMDYEMGHNVMVNYLYSRDPSEIAANRAAYARAVTAQRAGHFDEARAILLPMMSASLREEVGDRTAVPPRLNPGRPGWAP